MAAINFDGSDVRTTPPQPPPKSNEPSMFSSTGRRNPEFFLKAAKYSSSHHITNLTAANEAYRGKSSFPPTIPGQMLSWRTDCFFWKWNRKKFVEIGVNLALINEICQSQIKCQLSIFLNSNPHILTV